MAADHGGLVIKERIKKWMEEQGTVVMDVGAETMDKNDDFVDYAIKAMEKANFTDGDMVVMFCRNGVGMSIIANRYKKARCVLGFGAEQVKKARMDDDVNVLAVGADYFSEAAVRAMVKNFLEEPFSGGERYRRRLSKLEVLGGIGK